MRLYVDDLRQPKQWGWTVVRTYEDAIQTLDAFWDSITEISLDNDFGTEKTGYDIAKWIEEQIEVNGRKPIPKMYVHSANPVGQQNIMAVFNKYNGDNK